MAVEMGSKRLDLARQLVPSATAVAMLINPRFPTASAEAREVQDAARSFGMHINLLNASTESEIDAAFATIVEQGNGALIIGTDPFLLGQRDQLVRLAARHMVPTIYFLREFVEAGGLMSYGPNIAHGYRQAGVYTGLILSGANPATLPVLRPTHFQLFLNLKTAKALGLEVPLLADEVAE
jgi:putative ABC transport system substrate-binding protein